VTPPRTEDPFAVDEHPRATSLEQLGKLKAAFQDGGTVTAGNSSGINDGAAAVVLMRRSEAKRRSLEPRLELRTWAVTGIEPEVMGYAPANAIPRALERPVSPSPRSTRSSSTRRSRCRPSRSCATRTSDEVRVNPSGGAIAFGHPVGATGAILTVKLMHALERTGGRHGVVTMCIGGGQGLAAVFSKS
jgi:acetyl-CoA C-acetyltransferase